MNTLIGVTVVSAQEDNIQLLSETVCESESDIWNVKIEFRNLKWFAKIERHDSENRILAVDSMELRWTRNFPEFGLASVQIKIPKVSDLPFDVLNLSDASSQNSGKVIHFGYLRSRSEAVKDSQLKCETTRNGNWKAFISQHDLNLLNEKAPTSVCKITTQKSGPHSPWTSVCSGALVHSRFLLTAGHCIQGAEIAKMKTRVECPGETPRLTQVGHVHPDFSVYLPYNSNDLGLIEFQNPIHSIRPVLMQGDNSEVENILQNSVQSCRMYGFGQRANGKTGTLGIAPLKLHPDPIERTRGRKFGFITIDPDTFLREGDSGGPVICSNSDGTDRLIAVNANLSESTITGNSLLISTEKNWNWIRSVLLGK